MATCGRKTWKKSGAKQLLFSLSMNCGAENLNFNTGYTLKIVLFEMHPRNLLENFMLFLS